MMRHLQRQAASEGIDFAPRSGASLLVNTHRALAASAWVQVEAPGRFEDFHHALFRGNFSENRDIGDAGVLRQIATAVGIDVSRMDAALEGGAGETALREATLGARRHGITAVPAFVFGGTLVVVGAQPAAALVQAAEQVAAGGRTV